MCKIRKVFEKVQVLWDNMQYLTNDIELDWFLDTGPIDGHTADIYMHSSDSWTEGIVEGTSAPSCSHDMNELAINKEQFRV